MVFTTGNGLVLPFPPHLLKCALLKSGTHSHSFPNSTTRFTLISLLFCAIYSDKFHTDDLAVQVGILNAACKVHDSGVH